MGATVVVAFATHLHVLNIVQSEPLFTRTSSVLYGSEYGPEGP